MINLPRNEKIKLLSQEFRQIDLNNDSKIEIEELLSYLDQKVRKKNNNNIYL